MIRTLFEEIAKPSRLKPLGLMGVLDRTGEALNRVDRAEFFKSFDTGHAVQHFYEPFLEAFDPELRKALGVWYTPPEIVRYMVARIDTVLRTELGVDDGLADKNVYVLDPCCGTGAYVVEVLRKIEETLRSKSDDALIGEDVKEAARERVFGFEIMSAPFVIAHWQVGNLLTSLKAPLDAGKGERPAIYLTNSLTGWEPPAGPKATLPLFPELEEERDQAEHVKREVPILVVLGNPPYNAFAGTSPDEEQGLVEAYKEGLVTVWGIKKFNLDDLYVRFFRIAERKITQTGRGNRLHERRLPRNGQAHARGSSGPICLFDRIQQRRHSRWNGRWPFRTTRGASRQTGGQIPRFLGGHETRGLAQQLGVQRL